MADRHINLRGHEVSAIRDGRQTQIWRKVRFPGWAAGIFTDPLKVEVETDEQGRDPDVICEDTGCLASLPLPYAVGDRLYVRETWCPDAEAPKSSFYRADGAHVVLDDGDGFTATNRNGSERSPWRSPIHMPRSRSRLTLIVTDIRVEQLQDISEADAIAEGMPDFGALCEALDPGKLNASEETAAQTASRLRWPQRWFESVWVDLHGHDAWSDNPWICAISFRPILSNIDVLPADALAFGAVA